MVYAAFAKRLRIERQRTGQQFIKQHAQRIDIRAGVDILRAHLRLLGAHVLRRADKLALLGVQRPFGQRLSEGLGDAEVDNLHDGFITLHGDQNVRRLHVAVDDALLVRIFERLANLVNDVQCAHRRQTVLDLGAQVAAVHVLHGDVDVLPGAADIVDGDDVGMAQGGDDAAFLHEALEEIPRIVLIGVEALEHDLAMQGLLNGEKNGRHSAPANGALYLETRDLHDTGL